MEQVYGAALIALASGAAILAVRHPNTYTKMLPGLLLSFSIVFLCAAVWDLSSGKLFHALYDLIPPEKKTEASTIREQHEIFSRLGLPILAAQAYLIVVYGISGMIRAYDKNESA